MRSRISRAIDGAITVLNVAGIVKSDSDENGAVKRSVWTLDDERALVDIAVRTLDDEKQTALNDFMDSLEGWQEEEFIKFFANQYSEKAKKSSAKKDKDKNKKDEPEKKLGDSPLAQALDYIAGFKYTSKIMERLKRSPYKLFQETPMNMDWTRGQAKKLGHKAVEASKEFIEETRSQYAEVGESFKRTEEDRKRAKKNAEKIRKEKKAARLKRREAKRRRK